MKKVIVNLGSIIRDQYVKEIFEEELNHPSYRRLRIVLENKKIQLIKTQNRLNKPKRIIKKECLEMAEEHASQKYEKLLEIANKNKRIKLKNEESKKRRDFEKAKFENKILADIVLKKEIKIELLSKLLKNKKSSTQKPNRPISDFL